MSGVTIESARLVLRRFEATDASFLLALFNDPDFMRFIGDRHLRTEDDAVRFINERFLTPFRDSPIGPWRIDERASGTPIGLGTLFQRDWLDAVDLGFALLPEARAHGYAMEASRALCDYARDTLGLTRLLAIASPHNERSLRLLERLGFHADGPVTPPGASSPVTLLSARLTPA